MLVAIPACLRRSVNAAAVNWPLVAVGDFGLSMRQGIAQRFQAKGATERIGQTPRQHEATVSIHDRHQVQEAVTHLLSSRALQILNRTNLSEADKEIGVS